MARKANRKMPKRGPSTAARKPARKPAGKKPAARKPAARKPAARKPGTGGRKPPTSGFGAAPRNPKKSARDGATNFSPEPNRIGRDAHVQYKARKFVVGTDEKQSDYPLMSTSEHFEYGPTGNPARRGGDRQAQSSQRYYTAWKRNRYSPQMRAGNLRRRAR